MEKLCLFLILAILRSGVLGLSFSNKLQVEEEKDLEDRFGFKRPNRPNWPGSGRVSGQFPRHHPGQSILFPGQQTIPAITTTVPTPNDNGATTRSTIVQDCIRICPVTSEYNPVCGSNGVTYDNPGRFRCAQVCGVAVTLLKASRCRQPAKVPSE